MGKLEAKNFSQGCLSIDELANILKLEVVDTRKLIELKFRNKTDFNYEDVMICIEYHFKYSQERGSAESRLMSILLKKRKAL